MNYNKILIIVGIVLALLIGIGVITSQSNESNIIDETNNSTVNGTYETQVTITDKKIQNKTDGVTEYEGGIVKDSYFTNYTVYKVEYDYIDKYDGKKYSWSCKVSKELYDYLEIGKSYTGIMKELTLKNVKK